MVSIIITLSKILHNLIAIACVTRCPISTFGSTAMTQPPTSPLATTAVLVLNQSMVVGTKVFDHAPVTPAKCKGPADTNHNLSALSKKKNNPIPATKKLHTRKPGTKSKVQASSPVPGTSTGSPVAAVSDTGEGKKSRNKLPLGELNSKTWNLFL